MISSKKQENTISLIIVDESQIIRNEMKSILKKELQVKIIGEATNKDGLLQMRFVPNADVILMNLEDPKLSSIYSAKELVKLFPKTRIIAVTLHYDNVILKVLEKVGFKGCIMKKDLSYEVFSAMNSVLHGGTFFKENFN